MGNFILALLGILSSALTAIMMVVKKPIHFILIFTLLFTLFLTGCGSNGSSGVDREDSVLKKIKDTKTLVVGTDATFPPFEFKSKDGKYEGFDIDLITAVAKELGADKVKFVDTEFKGLIPGLQGNKFDIIVSAMYITDERKQVIDFSNSYYPGGLAIMVSKDNNDIKSIDDLNGKKVAVQIGTKSVEFLEKNYPKIHLVKVEQNVEMFMQLESKRVDAVVTGLPAAKVYTKEHGTTKVLPDTLTKEYYGYGIRKENNGFTNAINKALKTLKDNGKYDEIVNKWFGQN